MASGQLPTRFDRWFEANDSGDTPIGVYAISFLFGIEGISAFRELYEAGATGISESPVLVGVYILVGITLVGVATAIWERRPIGWLSGVIIGIVLSVVYMYNTITAELWNSVGILIAALIIGHLIIRRDVFLDNS